MYYLIKLSAFKQKQMDCEEKPSYIFVRSASIVTVHKPLMQLQKVF